MNKKHALAVLCTMLFVVTLAVCQSSIMKAAMAALTNNVFAQTNQSDDERKARVSSPNGLKPVPPDLQIPARGEQVTSIGTLLEGKRAPEHVIYNQIFRHLKELNRQADDEERHGKDGNHLRQLYKRLAKLDDAQAVILDRVAAETNRDVERLNAEAGKIIKAFREKHKGKKKDDLPDPPNELILLSQERKQNVLRARDKLRYSIGDKAFDKFDKFVNERITPGIYQLQLKGQTQQKLSQAQNQKSPTTGLRRRTRTGKSETRIPDAAQPNLAEVPQDCYWDCYCYYDCYGGGCYVQNIYGSSWTWHDGRYVYSYGATELDYCAGLYYDPAVYTKFTEGNQRYENERLLGEGYDEGYADWYPAEVGFRYGNPIGNEYYNTDSRHYVIDYYYGGTDFVGYTFHTIRFPPPADQCQPGQSFAPNGNPCPTPSPSPSPSPTPDTRFQVFLQSQNFVRPAGTTVVEGQTTSVVRVLTQPAQPGKTVTLRLEGYADTGGHIDALHKRNLDGTSGRPLGRLRASRGTTNNGGAFETTYTPSHIAGKIKITATIDNIDVANDMFISVPNLIELQDGVNYVLTGFDNTPEHPQGTNHFGTYDANVNLIRIADAYRDEYYPAPNQIPEDKKVLLNDQSLPFGGKFDLKPDKTTPPNWAATGSHAEHREGMNCDFASKNIPTDRWTKMKEIFRDNGSPNYKDETTTSSPHWHLRFTGDTQQAALTRSAGNFVDENFWSPLDRAANDAEWEYWISRIESAQTQGFDATLAEAKTFERALFQSTEYVNRNRNDENYISDLYWGYLQREPDVGEYNARLQALRNANANGQNGREQVLRMFEDDPEFIGIVSSIQGTATPPVGCDPVQEQDCYNSGGSWDFSTCSCNYNPDPCWNGSYYTCE